VSDNLNIAPLPLPVEIVGGTAPAPAPNTTAEQDRQTAGERLAARTTAPTTTEEEDRKTAGQRRINIIWEVTQAMVTVSITGAEIYAQLHSIQAPMLDAAFFAVTSTYLARTNHTKMGGIGTRLGDTR